MCWFPKGMTRMSSKVIGHARAHVCSESSSSFLSQTFSTHGFEVEACGVRSCSYKNKLPWAPGARAIQGGNTCKMLYKRHIRQLDHILTFFLGHQEFMEIQNSSPKMKRVQKVQNRIRNRARNNCSALYMQFLY